MEVSDVQELVLILRTDNVLLGFLIKVRLLFVFQTQFMASQEAVENRLGPTARCVETSQAQGESVG